MKRINKITLLTILLSTLIMAPRVSAKADPYGAFNIVPIFPENQISETSSFYDLKMEENQEQEIFLDIVNSGDEVMVTNISLNNGSTDVNAEKSYEPNIEMDSSMVKPMTEIAHLDTQEVIVQPNSTERIMINLKAPSEAFSGVSLGGVIVTADYKESKSKDKEGFTVGNRLAYVVAIQVRMNDEAIESNLNYLSTEIVKSMDGTKFVSKIQNDQAEVLNNVSIEGTVTDQNGKIVSNISKEHGGILPNTQFEIHYENENEEDFESGGYNIDLKISSDDKQWEWKDTLVYEKVEADIQKIDTPSKVNIPPIITTGSALLLIIVIVYLKQKKEN